MHTIALAIERISDWAAKLSAVILFALTVLILLEILLWNLFEKTTLIADEYSAYGLAAIIFLGAGYCLKEKGHIRITLVLGFLPPKLARVIAFAATVLTTVFMGYLWWYLFLMVSSHYRYCSSSGSLTHTPLWIPQTLMLVGAACFLLQFVGTSVRVFEAIETGEEVI